MSRKSYEQLKVKGTSLLASIALLVSVSALAPAPVQQKAFADPSSSELRAQSKELKDELADIQLDLEKKSDDYDRVLTEQQAAEATAAEAQAAADTAQAQKAQLQEQMGARVKEMYTKGDLTSTINMLLDVRSFEEALQAFSYIENLNRNDAKMVEASQTLKEEVELKKETADEQALLAAEKAEEARLIKEEAQAKVDEYESKIANLDEQARQKALQESAQIAARQAQAASKSYTTVASDIPSHGDVVDYAYSRCGCPYVWAGSGPNYFDCSGLVMWCYAQVGISLPHSSESMYARASARIPVSEAQPGDVLYRYGHVALCIEPGGQTYIHAPQSGDVVRVASYSMFSCALRF